MKNNKKRLTFLGIAIALMTILVTPAVANTLKTATATANCAGYSLTVSATDLSPGTTYTINYTFTVTPPSTTFSGTITFTATASAATETASGTWSLTSNSTVTGSATLTNSGSTRPITINGSSSATLSCGVGGGVGDPSFFFTTYYSNANTTGAPDATVRIVNDGNTDGSLYADIYVLDDSQELQECCGCFVSKDGLLSESVDLDLTANSLTGKVNHRGVIKIFSDSNVNGWDAGSAVKPTAGLRVSATHVQSLAAAEAGTYALTETNANDANLGTVEQALLPEECGFIVGTEDAAGLGSGAGVCTCTAEDWDF